MKRLLLLVGSALGTTGCANVDRQQESTTHTVRSIHAEGVYAGQPFVINGTEEVTTDHKATEHRQYSIDPQLLQMAAGGAATLGTGGWAAIGTGAVSLVLAGIASAQKKRADEHKADSDEGWSKYEAAMKATKGIANG